MISLQSAFFFLKDAFPPTYTASVRERDPMAGRWRRVGVGGGDVRACWFEFYGERSYACLRCANGCETDERKFAGMRLS